VKAAAGVGHVAQQVVERLLADAPAFRIAEGEPRVQVERGELGVVVEHLLEVRHHPVRVDGVAREAAADLIVHPAARHPDQRRVHHALRVGVPRPLEEAQDELPDHRLRKLRRAALSAPLLVELRGDALEGGVQHLLREQRRRAAQPLALPERLGQLAPRLEDFAAPRAPGVGDRRQQLREAGQAVPVLGREVRPAVERRAVRREEDRHRPAAAAGHGLHGLHVDVIDVRPLLAVHLHVDEPRVHHLGDRRVLERLALHHVTPVAGRVPDREQERLVLRAGARERVLAPRVPVHRVVGVLEQVWARLAGQAVLAHARRIIEARHGVAGARPRVEGVGAMSGPPLNGSTVTR
jgi:hypothetical protein